MTIDRDKLVELLVQKTGLEKDKIESQLGELVHRIQEAANAGKNFEIEGFGTFSVKDDTLHFEPAGPVETEINHKYSGMKPIELIGAFKDTEGRPMASEPEEEAGPEAGSETGPEAGPEEKEAPVWGFDEEAGETGATPEEAGEPETEPEPESETESEKDPASDKTSVFHFDTTEKNIFEELEEEPEQVEAAEPKKKTKDRKKRRHRQQSDPLGKVLIYLVIGIVILVSGWFIYDSGILNRRGVDANDLAVQKQDENTQMEAPANRDQQPQATNPAQTQTQTGQQQRDQAQTQTGQQQQAVPNEPVYGLKGEVNPDANDGYTIVIHSLRSENKARSISSNMARQGYRNVLTSAVVNGTTYWRVGIGQFETVRDAQSAAGELPSQYRNNHFIKRIQ